ncbi:hypothetical protein [Streptomyces sp. NPDC008121]|uniref:hypothetical protein n=1 Tax=Streptomyces sp. NPDC008121 TaxID=3364809 RepID=UPI0036EEBECF
MPTGVAVVCDTDGCLAVLLAVETGTDGDERSADDVSQRARKAAEGDGWVLSFDFMDRTWWGDPEADWPTRMARAKQDERLSFFEACPAPEDTASVRWRRHVYEVRHLGALRLERHRLNNPAGVRDSYPAMAAELSALAS